MEHQIVVSCAKWEKAACKVENKGEVQEGLYVAWC